MLSKVGLSQVDGWYGRSIMAAIDNLVLRPIEFVEYIADSLVCGRIHRWGCIMVAALELYGNKAKSWVEIKMNQIRRVLTMQKLKSLPSRLVLLDLQYILFVSLSQ